ncbi:MAG: arylsulfatase A-like enzyme [Verrucomicrobiales bacterium]|jgi:arylsulfatase A-like enzyme
MLALTFRLSAEDRPNIVLVMADDQGWGQTSYNNHPILKTPNLDAMAENGLRFDRFYASGPVCSPTRASVLTGRQHQRTGVPSHGYALRLQEQTIAHALRDAGYRTGHFGKWHLNGIRGPGVPILKDDAHSPGAHGFDEWITVTNFFDMDPIMSRKGEFEEFKGDSSEIIVQQLLDFFESNVKAKAPLFGVVWYGTPHNPFKASDEDLAPFADLDEQSKNQYGELVAMDRSIGTLRQGLRDLGVADNTLVLFCSDNGGLPKIKPETVGGLRGYKGSVYEGGIRVPGILEWPAMVKPRVTDYPASTMDIFPTIAEIVGLPKSAMPLPLDGVSFKPLLDGAEPESREEPIPFHYSGWGALVDNEWKLVRHKNGSSQLYNLVEDHDESEDLSAANPDVLARLNGYYETWNKAAEASIEGKDYPEGQVNPGENPEPRFWTDMDEYRPYFDEWRERWEYASRLKKKK